MNNQKNRTKNIAITAMFAALAFASTIACSYIPKVSGFLSLEVKDSIIVLCSLIIGPIWGAAIAVIVPLLELITISTTGWYGLIMNILSSLTFCMASGLIYKYKRSFYGAVVGLASGVASVTAVMLLANLLITPHYIHAPAETVAEMIPTVLLPFNLVKATLNGAIVLLLYKPLSTILKRMGFIEKKAQIEKNKGFYLRSLIVTVIAALVIAGSLCVIFFVLK